MLTYVITPWKSSCDCNFLHSDNAPSQSRVKSSQNPTTTRYAYFVLCCGTSCIMLLHSCNSARKYIRLSEVKIKIYEAVFKHHSCKRELCCNQYATLKTKAKKRERQKELTLCAKKLLAVKALRTPTGRMDFLASPQTWLAMLHLMITRLLMKPQPAHLVQLPWDNWRHYPYPCCGHHWLPACFSLQNIPTVDAPGQLALIFLIPEWAWWILALTPCWPKPLQAEHHGLLPATPNPVGGCRRHCSTPWT